MHYVLYKQRSFVRWLLLSLLSLALAACSTTSVPQLENDSGTATDFAYVAKADISPEATQAEVEAMYGGSTILFKPEAGFAILGFSEDEAALTTLSTDPNQDAFSSPEASAAGVDAWAGGVDAWAGGWDAWAGGWDAWAGGWDAWAGGWDAWAGGHGAWSGGHGAWSGGADIALSTFGENLAIWDQINLPQGQRLAPRLGEGIIVAVLDTGLTSNHPAFSGYNIDFINDWDFVSNDSGTWDEWESDYANTARGHGTAIAGIILQVAPKATILPVRVLDPDGNGDTDDIISAIDWAVQKGADVINLSVGTDVEVAALRAMIDYAASQGVFVVTSAGNENSALTYPARWANDGSQTDPFLLSVGSVDAYDRKSGFSNYGSGLELLAPGEGIYTSLYKSGEEHYNGAVSGTSFAAPLASGSLALALAEKPDLSPRTTFQYEIRNAAHNIETFNPSFVGKLGYGRLDVEAYLERLGLQAPAPNKEALFIVGSLPYNEGDAKFAERLELLGFRVTTYVDVIASAGQASGKDVVVISASVNEATIAAKFRDVAVPVVTFEEKIFDDMKMASSFGSGTSLTHIQIANHADQVAVFESGNKVAWGTPSSGAEVLATLTYDANKAAIFSYEPGSQMVGMTAPAKRVGLFHNYYGAQHTAKGWAFFDSAVVWAATPVTSSLEVRVSQSSDDAEQDASSGSMYLNSSDLELVNEPGGANLQEVGIRFQNVSIPQGATITAAYLEFETDETNSGSTSLTIHGEATNSAATFTTQSYNISNRAKTSASVAWNNIAAWSQVNQKHQTPNLAAVVQEIVNRGGWSSGNSMAFIITGSGERTAESYNGEPANAPLLRVEYTQ